MVRLIARSSCDVRQRGRSSDTGIRPIWEISVVVMDPLPSNISKSIMASVTSALSNSVNRQTKYFVKRAEGILLRTS